MYYVCINSACSVNFQIIRGFPVPVQIYQFSCIAPETVQTIPLYCHLLDWYFQKLSNYTHFLQKRMNPGFCELSNRITGYPDIYIFFLIFANIKNSQHIAAQSMEQFPLDFFLLVFFFQFEAYIFRNCRYKICKYCRERIYRQLQ